MDVAIMKLSLIMLCLASTGVINANPFSGDESEVPENPGDDQTGNEESFLPEIYNNDGKEREDDFVEDGDQSNTGMNQPSFTINKEEKELVHIVRALELAKNRLNRKEIEMLDDMLDRGAEPNVCRNPNELDKDEIMDDDLVEDPIHSRKKRSCGRSCSTRCGWDRCSATGCCTQPRCYCSWWWGRAKCRC